LGPYRFPALRRIKQRGGHVFEEVFLLPSVLCPLPPGKVFFRRQMMHYCDTGHTGMKGSKLSLQEKITMTQLIDKVEVGVGMAWQGGVSLDGENIDGMPGPFNLIDKITIIQISSGNLFDRAVDYQDKIRHTSIITVLNVIDNDKMYVYFIEV
jgi:hypothetical protein